MQYKSRGRAYRRHHYSRLKTKRVRECYWGIGWYSAAEEWDKGHWEWQ